MLVSAAPKRQPPTPTPTQKKIKKTVTGLKLFIHQFVNENILYIESQTTDENG